jgi:hypothetical protein
MLLLDCGIPAVVRIRYFRNEGLSEGRRYGDKKLYNMELKTKLGKKVYR